MIKLIFDESAYDIICVHFVNSPNSFFF